MWEQHRPGGLEARRTACRVPRRETLPAGQKRRSRATVATGECEVSLAGPCVVSCRFKVALTAPGLCLRQVLGSSKNELPDQISFGIVDGFRVAYFE